MRRLLMVLLLAACVVPDAGWAQATGDQMDRLSLEALTTPAPGGNPGPSYGRHRSFARSAVRGSRAAATRRGGYAVRSRGGMRVARPLRGRRGATYVRPQLGTRGRSYLGTSARRPSFYRPSYRPSYRASTRYRPAYHRGTHGRRPFTQR